MRRVYIVLSAAGVGGAEKRFTDIWHSLVTQGMNVHLVIDLPTYRGLIQQSGYAEKLANRPELHVFDLGGNNYKRFVKSSWDFFKEQPKHAIVHYPLAYAPIIQSQFGHKLIISWVNSNMPPLSHAAWRNGISAWASFFAADHIDILNPENFHRIRKVFGLASKTSLTVGGTHIDANLFQPLDKELDFVFLGRVEPEKQCLRLVEALPNVHRILQAAGMSGYRFVVCGDGSDAAAIRTLTKSECFKSLPFKFSFSYHPEKVLARAAVFFSLQRTSNYPSKALAEAMACGAFPVMTQVGESALMIEGCKHYHFVPRDFSSADIAEALLSYSALNVVERCAVAREISEFASKRFTIEKQSTYFSDLYSRIGQS